MCTFGASALLQIAQVVPTLMTVETSGAQRVIRLEARVCHTATGTAAAPTELELMVNWTATLATRPRVLITGHRKKQRPDG